MLHRTHRTYVLPLSLLLAVWSSACADSAGPGGDTRLEVRASTQGPAVQDGSSAVELEVARILLVVGRVKLEKSGRTGTDFVDERSIVIELDPGDAPVLAFSADVPEGEFKELEIAVDKLESGQPFEQALIDEHPELSNASILIEGTIGDDEFRFAADLDIDLELIFDPPLALVDGDTPITLVSLTLDVTDWFRGPSGELLDPRDPANRSIIESNVQKSLELFEGVAPLVD